MPTKEMTIDLPDGRALHAYDTGDQGAVRLAVFWLHGTPNIGEPPEPLLSTADRLGLRWVSYDRPGYGGSDPQAGRTVASAAADMSAIADALDIPRFAIMGHSGGSSHALACGAVLAGRVVAIVAAAGLAPIDAPGLDWFAGMVASTAAENRAAMAGRATLERHLRSAEFDMSVFTAGDLAALDGTWTWLNEVARRGTEGGLDGLIDDSLAFVSPWGCDLAAIGTPTLILHGGQDRFVPSSHGEWLAEHLSTATLWLAPEAGHITVLDQAEAALDWIAGTAKGD